MEGLSRVDQAIRESEGKAYGAGGVLGAIARERLRQLREWTPDHDRSHELFEWVGLIAMYASRGEYVKAGALCVAAEQARIQNSAIRELSLPSIEDIRGFIPDLRP